MIVDLLIVLAIPPMLAGTYAGIDEVDPAARDAARGMGMRGGQVLFKVEIPCALPLMFSGLRSALGVTEAVVSPERIMSAIASRGAAATSRAGAGFGGSTARTSRTGCGAGFAATGCAVSWATLAVTWPNVASRLA